MELRQIEYFVAVAEESHFTRAAKRMRVAQSGLSASIRALERELGAALFLRNTRQVELTTAGEAFLTEARRALSATDAAREAVSAVQGLLRGNLAVGSLQCLHVVHLPKVLAGFLRAHPGLEIQLRHGGSGELVEQVRTGGLDVAFVSGSARVPDGLVAEALAAEPLVLACAPGHPLAGESRISLARLRDERFVDFPADWGARDLADEVLAEAGVERRVALEVTDVHSLLDLVACGLGVALVPQSFSVKTDKVCFLGLDGRPPQWRTVSVTRAAASTAATELLREVAVAKSGRLSVSR
ncbi:LysR family transcriptional regulator [Amycolatopsis acidiphila]|uniref:LysR family transcriptional regulator n=1 Tax=Amycolatopsis acidiphila TaxID=715473 RepID=A0A558A4P4_9PSEU|nr:LysR family transcriptional regulator [Amycolatopsis acidiphila]